jgi:hypothetical protein
MDLGSRKRLQREQLRREYGTVKVEGDYPGTIWLSVALLLLGCTVGGFAHMPIATGLHQLYCTPQACATLPQALTGWAIAVAPLVVYLWSRTAAVHLGMLLLGCTGTLFVTSNDDVPVEINPVFDLWVLPLTYFLVGLLFVPLSLGISRLAKPGWRATTVAGQHWLLLAGLVAWLA